MYPLVPRPAYLHEDTGFLIAWIWNHRRSRQKTGCARLLRLDLITISHNLITSYYRSCLWFTAVE